MLCSGDIYSRVRLYLLTDDIVPLLHDAEYFVSKIIALIKRVFNNKY